MVVASCIEVSSPSVSFCGDMAGDLTATRFLAEEPVILLEGVLMAGIGFGMMWGNCRRGDVQVGGLDGTPCALNCSSVCACAEFAVVDLGKTGWGCETEDFDRMDL